LLGTLGGLLSKGKQSKAKQSEIPKASESPNINC
jgi:hypothetical protein